MMAFAYKTLSRHGAALVLAVAAAGCKSDGTGIDDGEIALALSATSATVEQGNATSATATLTRSGGFTGPVQFAVTGAPAGITATVSNPQTTGLVTSGTLNVEVGPAAAPGTYQLTVTGTGAGVSPATANFALTVTAAPAASYTLSLTSAALAIAQGASTPTTTVNINRTNFTGEVTLSVANLPSGVTAAFAPHPVTGNTSVLTLSVGGAVTPGEYNLTVNGTGTAGNQSTPLVLTVTAAGGSATAR
jgi:uncharacterized membrane protein